ncbi:efflux RND transporter permease subunit [Inhella gelatinilytica]|uniref:Efflux RND transporter permease subunit n=1 Tax=Inhella gelatinilytica TaxID=2795030 RepID=A0A931IY93_9BURK|nr:efflux RND transporter permease subunit [Inhella gelatinilytica]MBH9553200.1 efflux RND transporter permease subunit [Inhella gelatinilytica]
MLNVSSWSIRKPVPSILLFIMLTVAGALAFRAMKIQNFPDIDLPTVIVTASLPGAAPAQMETEVARKIENSIASIQSLKHTYTKVYDGVAVVAAEFRLEKATQDAMDDVRDAVARVRSDLPAELRDPVISKMDLAASPVLVYTLASDRRDEEAISWLIDNEVSKKLLSVRGVGGVARVGGVKREFQVELDPDRLLALRVSAAEVSRRLREVQQEAPAGRATVGGIEQSMRVLGTVQDAQQLAALEIPLYDGRRIRLDQVATVKDGVAERRSAAQLDGKPVVAFEVTRARGAGEVDVMHGVRAALADIQAANPDLQLVEAFNFVDPVVENYEGSMALLLEGALLAVLVVWLFLRDGRATFVSAVALPLSAIPTFLFMYWMGFTINIVTLLSLSLVIGILVDDAIVEIENIMRHLTMGKTPFQAAMEAADEIGMAVIATTFTLIAVFLPTAFMSGVPGKFFVQFGWTAALAVFFSLVVARMLTPMMAAYLLKKPTKPHPEPFWMPMYMRWAKWCLQHRGKTLAGIVAFGVASCAPLFLGAIPGAFIPPDDLSQTQVYLQLEPGSRLAQTQAVAEAARSRVAAHPHVKQIYTAIGGGAAGSDPFQGSGAPEVRKATLTLNLTKRQDRPGVSKQQIERELRERLADLTGVRVNVGFGGSAEKYILVLSGDDGDTLLAHATQVEQQLRTLKGIGQVTSSSSLQRPELVLRPDSARAADLGVSTAAMADTLRIATSGDYDQALPKINLADRQVPVVVKLPDAARSDLDLIKQLTVPGTHGPVALQQAAEVELAAGPAQIDRFDRARNVNFEIELNGRALGEVAAEADQLPALKNLPPGIQKTVTGDAEAFAELSASFLLAMGTGVACIYIVLVLLFHAWVQPATILVALVLSIPGAILALFVTQTDLSMPAMIGMIMLMGIATKNSILLIEYAIVARDERGLSRLEALLDACHKRARPIVMTTLAMGAGMLPIALGFGTDPSFRAPMAIVVIGGLITSTFLSLLVVPVVYTWVDDGVAWFQRRVRRQPGAAAQPEA